MVRIEEEKTFYAPVINPTELRSNILGSIKKMLVMLKRYENFRSIRQEKVRRTHELKILVKELEYLNKKLVTALPKTHLRAPIDRAKKEPKKHEEKPKEDKEISELDKLELELQSVESKLKELE